ncbi:probable G-protein coupled receptor 150 [Sceloporus undulatus]|uniref:probable G-protein coupled receptor 150 n=1 Tax=Sceloporus undulatus TaxID=8520 RepID=UPI001C4DAF74|nr:probable G-protein coupled receptor 150 [Sceloporus undulatus]
MAEEEEALTQAGPNLSTGALHPAPPSNFSPGPGTDPARVPTPAAPALLLLLLLLFSLAGNALLLGRLRCGGLFCCCRCRRGPRRKMDFFLAHLALADLYGSGALLLLLSLPPEGSSEASCRLLRLLRGSGRLAPSHLVLLLALERRSLLLLRSPSATASPFLRLPPRGALAGLGWLLALLLALPEAFAFRLLGGRCLSVFPAKPRWQGAAYAVYGALTGFVAPACLLGFLCGGLLWALGRKEAEEEAEGEGQRREPSGEAARCCSAWPPRSRAIQLALALAALFALCGFPRFLLEVASFPDGASRAAVAEDFLSASQAALNPCLCLLFRGRRRSFLCPCPAPRAQPRRQQQRRRRRARPRTPSPQPPAALPKAPRGLCPCQAQPEEEERSPDAQEPGSSPF